MVADVATVSPITYYVHTDHPSAVAGGQAEAPLTSRPILLTNSAKSAVWDAVWLPFGGAHSITGTLTHEHRLPGQWYQLEAGLHYNWHRYYDPSIGRYTQPDPLGFVDGPSQYAYALSGPQMYVDPDGRNIIVIIRRAFGLGYTIGRGIRRFIKDEQGAKRPSKNQTENQQAHDALKEACRREGVDLNRELQRVFHDEITGQGHEGYKELLEEAIQFLRQRGGG